MSGQIAVQLARGHCRRQPTRERCWPGWVVGVASERPGKLGRARGSRAGPGPPLAPVLGADTAFPTWTTLTL